MSHKKDKSYPKWCYPQCWLCSKPTNTVFSPWHLLLDQDKPWMSLLLFWAGIWWWGHSLYITTVVKIQTKFCSISWKKQGLTISPALPMDTRVKHTEDNRNFHTGLKLAGRSTSWGSKSTIPVGSNLTQIILTLPSSTFWVNFNIPWRQQQNQVALVFHADPQLNIWSIMYAWV